MARGFVVRYIGFCAVCERDIKIGPDGKLVHHGYQRPGDGRIHGDCPAVGHEPYERSHTILDVLEKSVSHSLLGARAALLRFERGEVNKFSGSVWDYRVGKRVPMTFERGKTPDREFARAYESHVHSLRMDIESLDREQKRLRKWIDDWRLKPIRDIEEVERAARSAVDARRDAARAEREAREAEKKSKVDARAAKQQAEVTAIGEEGVRLASLATSAPSAPADLARMRRDLERLSKRIEKADRYANSFHFRGGPGWDVMLTPRALEALLALRLLRWHTSSTWHRDGEKKHRYVTTVQPGG